MYIERNIQTYLKKSQNDYPSITVYGARQVGKSTMLKHVFKDFKYVSLDNLEDRDLANTNPKLFLENYGTKLIVDEIQKSPNLIDQVKNEIDVEVRAKIISQGGESGTINGSYTKTQGVSCKDICFAMGGGSVFFSLTYSGSYSPFTDFSTGEKYYIYSWTASGKFEYFDTFKDPPDLGNWWEKDIEIPGGTPYNYGHIWETASQIKVQGGLIRRPE